MKQSDLRGVIIVDSIHDILLEFSGQARLIFGNTLKKIILYGSYARGDQNEHSDIDIMILVDADDVEIAESTYHMAGLCFENQGYRDVVAYFNQHYVATEKFEREMGKRIGRLKTMREECDYDDFYVIERDEVLEQLRTAEIVIGAVKHYMESQGVM